ncbi:MAG: SAM-dependent chlorinase/fluorinase [Kiloniellales bacterium]
MLVLFTDFGPAGPYMGQMKAVLAREAPGVPIIELLSDAPAFDTQAAAYLLAAFAPEFPEGSVFLTVVDPGVGSARAPVMVSAAGRWYVGPDNGVFAMVMRRGGDARLWDITWRPERLSASFHGRDLFAPVAARLAHGAEPPGEERPSDTIRAMPGADWPDDLSRVVYIDHFGNALTGLRASVLADDTVLAAGGRELHRARTFSDLPLGEAFWYENANGLAEIAVNQGRASEELGLGVGSEVKVVAPPRESP